MDKVRKIVLLFAAAMAIFSLICSVYQAMNDRNISSGVLAGIFLASTFVAFLPKLEILEAFGVKAHLVRTLNEADELLAKLRQLAVTNAKAVYMNVGIANRMGPSRAAEKQAMLDEINKQLSNLQVSDVELRSLSQTYVRLIGFDFYMLYARILERYFQFKEQDMQRELSKDGSRQGLKARLDAWRVGRPFWKPNYDLFSQIEGYSFDDEINRITPKGWLNEEEQAGVSKFKNEITRLFKDSQAKGGMTAEAAEYYDKYSDLSGYDKKIIELFDFNPSALR